MDVTVTDVETLFANAMDHAQVCMSESDALETLRPDGEIDIGACITMILDPGVSPDGMAIEQSFVEAYA